MIRALYSAATGMQAQQKNLEVIANNLANVNTTGFKRSRAEFQDLLYQSERPAGADQGNGNLAPSGVNIGHGSRLVSTTKLFTTGELSNTGDRYNVAITGDGFF
ncbi:MAG: flagellar hook-basal body complex protein, partial [Planctomycetia bacterium]|nr:flagellar hook-basal body complex protein [Planctomycetia bacterium]